MEVQQDFRDLLALLTARIQSLKRRGPIEARSKLVPVCAAAGGTNKEWWFATGDVVEVLTDTVNSSGYIKKMLKRNGELSKGWGQIATPLWLATESGVQKINCADTKGIFRIIQSIPSPKTEHFNRWLT